MKNLLYCCCIADPWREVAQNLKLAGKFKPVYWIGWREDSKDSITNTFTDCTYHNIDDAWKGIFPEDISYISRSQLDGFELSEYASEELMAIKMMERLDPDQQSFTFDERKYYFRYLLKAWLNILKVKNIELIVAPSIPHRVFDYALYVAADILKIKFLTFKMTVWPGYIIPFYDIDKLNPIEQKEAIEIDEEVHSYIEKVTSTYQNAEPDYMKKQARDANLSLIRRIVIYIQKYQLSAVPKLFKRSTIYWKKKNERIQESEFLKVEYFQKVILGYRFKKRLKKYYESICQSYQKDDKYVFVALHYQPEETSCPSGNIFVDQALMIEALSKHLPDDIFIYVKEHPSQFNPKMEGHTGRNKSFYDKVKNIDRVKFISTTVNSFKLIDDSFAVATLTGTVGVEAMIRGKCAIVFGSAWYESLKGVIKIKGPEDLDSLYTNIKERLVSKNVIMKGLTSIRSESIKAYHYKGVKENSIITKNETIRNLTNYLRDIRL